MHKSKTRLGGQPEPGAWAAWLSVKTWSNPSWAGLPGTQEPSSLLLVYWLSKTDHCSLPQGLGLSSVGSEGPATSVGLSCRRRWGPWGIQHSVAGRRLLLVLLVTSPFQAELTGAADEEEKKKVTFVL